MVTGKLDVRNVALEGIIEREEEEDAPHDERAAEEELMEEEEPESYGKTGDDELE